MPTVLRTTLLLFASIACPLAAQPGPVLPTVTAYSLDKVRTTLPADLSGSHNILILYFQPDQSMAAEQWNRAVQPIKYTHPGLQSYVLPIYPRENFLYRLWVTATLRGSDLFTADRHTTVPIFVDKAPFLQSLTVSDDKQPVVLLSDKAGHIEWKTQGPADDAHATSLIAAVSATEPASHNHPAEAARPPGH